MTIRVPVGAGERDEKYLAWQVEDFVREMLNSELRKPGSIRVWLDSVQSNFPGVVEVLKEGLKGNKGLAQLELGRQVQVLGTDEESQAVLWAVHERLLAHIRPCSVAPADEAGLPDPVLAAG